MKFFASETQDKQKLFFGNADSFSLIRQPISKNTILRELKLSCLLYDHVVLAAAYFWQSDIMRSLRPYLEPLIENGDLLPAIRDYSQTSDASDYLERRMEETSLFLNKPPIYNIPGITTEIARGIASEIAIPENQPIANVLNKIGTFFYIDTGSIEIIYRGLWNDDISSNKNPHSLYNLIDFFVPQKYHHYLIKSLKEMLNRQYFSRSLIASYILDLKIPKDFKILFIERASELYLLSNAIAINGDLFASSRVSKLFCNYHGNSLGPLAKQNIYLFSEVLELCGLPVTIIDKMSAQELLKLKYSEEFVAFRSLYSNLINRANNTQKDLETEIIEQFYYQKKLERGKKVILVRLLSILEFGSSSVFFNTLSSVWLSGFPPTAPALILGSGVTFSISFFLKKIQKIKETPLLDFIELINEGKFGNSLQANLLRLESHLK